MVRSQVIVKRVVLMVMVFFFIWLTLLGISAMVVINSSVGQAGCTGPGQDPPTDTQARRKQQSRAGPDPANHQSITPESMRTDSQPESSANDQPTSSEFKRTCTKRLRLQDLMDEMVMAVTSV